MSKLTIYILELENGKYYVGRSTCSKSRILQHFNNNGSEWTKLHKPIRIISQIKTNDPFDEEKHTLLTMDKYGIDNVRGGSYCATELSKNDKKKALQTIASIMDRCYKCNEGGHFANECPKQNNTNEILNDMNDETNEIFEHDLSIYEILKDEIRNNEQIGEDIYHGALFYNIVNNKNPDCDQCGDSGFWWTGDICWFCHCQTCKRRDKKCNCIKCESCDQKILNEKYDEHKFICCRWCKEEIENNETHECKIMLGDLYDCNSLFSKIVNYIGLDNFNIIVDDDEHKMFKIDVNYELIETILLNDIQHTRINNDFVIIRTHANLNNIFGLSLAKLPHFDK